MKSAPVVAAKNKSVAREPHGFTLLELMVALVIIGLMAGVVVPNFGRMMDKMAFRSEVQRLQALLRFARSNSISRWKPHAVIFDLDANTIYIETVDDEESSSPSEDAQENYEELEDSYKEQREEREVSGDDRYQEIMNEVFELDEGISLAEFSRGGSSDLLGRSSTGQTSGVALILFQPLGTSSGGRIELRDDDDRSVVIEVAPLTGQPTVEWNKRSY